MRALKQPESVLQKLSSVASYDVVAVSNGHHWIKTRYSFVACRDCGFIRRADDRNKPCPGVVKVGPRNP